MSDYKEIDGCFENLSRIADEHQFYEISQFGIFNHLFNKGDDLICTQIFGAIDRYILSEGFDEHFRIAYQRPIEHEITGLRRKKVDAQSASRSNAMIDMQITAAEERLLVKSVQDYKDQEDKVRAVNIDFLVAEYCVWNKEVDEEKAREHISSVYFQYKIGGILYDDYNLRMKNNEMFEDRIPAIVANKYLEKKIDLKAIDGEFSQYKLLSFVDGMEIINAHESQTLKDRRIPGWYLYLKVPRDLLSAIEDLHQKGMIAKIAFWIDWVAEGVPALEELEVGRYFNFGALDLPPLSRLYDNENYHDQLWVKVEINDNGDKYPHSMTFEELCSDDVQFEGRVITQVIHLEFKKIGQDYFISHLDHEFISYTTEQYEARKTDGAIKGNRQKTFKIDASKIPFDFKFDGKYFMFLVLDTLFRNKGNVKEYFSGIAKGMS